MSEVPSEVKIIHIHEASDNHENFVEFVIIKSGKTHILRESGFIKRYGSEAIQKFQNKI